MSVDISSEATPSSSAACGVEAPSDLLLGLRTSKSVRKKNFYFQINPSDLRVEAASVGRFGGAGPEYVRVIHRPSGIQVSGKVLRQSTRKKLLTDLEKKVWEWQHQLSLPEAPRKRPIRASNTGLRFYARDGWTKEALDLICIKGEVRCSHPNDEDPYYMLDRDQGSRFDCERLLEHCSMLHRAFDDYPNESDLEFVRRLNR